ncbi:GTP-binding protein [Tulasnella sp. JGI-2019a]|nr:GTP-binding protein [Tulasnella sp. JGI-2019a]KAG8989807.1 GTP-binding protein [Tulasnella sp. JGI-2019a]
MHVQRQRQQSGARLNMKHPKPRFPLQLATTSATIRQLPFTRCSLLETVPRSQFLGVGKSCILSRHIGHGWIPSSTPTAGIHFEVHNLLICEGSILIKDVYWDVSGTEDRSQLGPYCMGMDAIWIVYDVTDQKSFEDVRQWFDLVMQYRSKADGIRLIGNKRDIHNRRVVQTQQGHDLAKALAIPQFFEMSARTNEGVQEMQVDHLGVWGRYKA